MVAGEAKARQNALVHLKENMWKEVFTCHMGSFDWLTLILIILVFVATTVAIGDGINSSLMFIYLLVVCTSRLNIKTDMVVVYLMATQRTCPLCFEVGEIVPILIVYFSDSKLGWSRHDIVLIVSYTLLDILLSIPFLIYILCSSTLLLRFAQKSC